VLPKGKGVFELTKGFAENGLALNPADLALLRFSPHFYALKLGLDGYKILKNHGIENIVDQLFSKTAIINNFNPKVQTIVDHAFWKIWS